MATRAHDADLAVTGKVSQTGTPSTGTDLITKTYGDANYGGGSGSGTKLSDLTSLSGASIVTADIMEILDISDTTMAASGTNKKTTLADLLTFLKANGLSREVHNASVASQGAGFSSDTYLTGSSCAVPSSSLQAKSGYYCSFNVTKTGAGTAAPVITLRFGTAGTTADAARGAHTFSAQTAVADEGMFEVWATFRTVGGGTSAVLQSTSRLTHRLSVTGLGTGVSESEIATSAGFDSTVASSIVGISVNGGASAAWTVSLVQAKLFNLT